MTYDKREYNASYYALHKQELNARAVLYNQTHRAERNARARAWRASHRDEARARNAAYYRAHKADWTAYYEAHKEHKRETNAAAYILHRSARISRASADHRAMKADALNAYGGPRCICCGETLMEGLTIDHIDGNGAEHRTSIGPGRIGGATFYRWLKKHGYPPGYQVLCGTCNLAKGTGDHCPHEDMHIAWG